MHFFNKKIKLISIRNILCVNFEICLSCRFYKCSGLQFDIQLLIPEILHYNIIVEGQDGGGIVLRARGQTTCPQHVSFMYLLELPKEAKWAF